MASFSLRDNSARLAERLVEGRVPPEVLSVCLSLTAQGKDVQGPVFSMYHTQLESTFHHLGLGGRREPVPLNHTCSGLSPSNRQLVAGWQTLMSCSSREESSLNGTGGGWRGSPVFLASGVLSRVSRSLSWDGRRRVGGRK